MSESQPVLDVTTDSLTERIARMQDQLDQLRGQLQESQRLATIGTIAAVIAHEFNNLLTPIVSYSQYALSSAQSPTPDMDLVRKALGKAYQSSSKAGKICGAMLGLARGESSFGRVEVRRLIEEALAVLARDPQKDGIALRVQVQPELAVSGDAVQLEQVLLNLLINARQALLGRGGGITIKASAISSADAGAETAGEALIQVIDTGPGIPEKHLPRIFEPFFTTKKAVTRGETRGTGLGLAICKEIVEHHHGRIQVQSEVGRGTTFNIYLPIGQ